MQQMDEQKSALAWGSREPTHWSHAILRISLPSLGLIHRPWVAPVPLMILSNSMLVTTLGRSP
jgi:hypothetical protein